MVLHLSAATRGCEKYDSGDYRAVIKSDTERQSQAGRSPKPGGGSQSLYLVSSGNQDRSDAEKSDAGYHLRAETGRIAGSVYLAEILICKHG